MARCSQGIRKSSTYLRSVRNSKMFGIRLNFTVSRHSKMVSGPLYLTPTSRPDASGSGQAYLYMHGEGLFWFFVRENPRHRCCPCSILIAIDSYLEFTLLITIDQNLAYQQDLSKYVIAVIAMKAKLIDVKIFWNILDLFAKRSSQLIMVTFTQLPFGKNTKVTKFSN